MSYSVPILEKEYVPPVDLKYTCSELKELLPRKFSECELDEVIVRRHGTPEIFDDLAASEKEQELNAFFIIEKS